VNKPSGTPSNTLESSSVDQPSMEEQLIRLRAPSSVFLLHRLDVGTSGILLFAKNENVYEKMRELFRVKKIHKRYWAFSKSSLTAELPLDITHALAHHPKSKKRMIVVEPLKMAKRPQTFYRGNPLPAHSRILSSEPVQWLGQSLYRYEIDIITGVMHQIRAHCRFLGIPLVGDPIYGEGPTPEFPRLGLHAKKVEFKLGDYLYQIEAPGP
jgi:23S rRNA pseudouridine1911/1915/1917 synthase